MGAIRNSNSLLKLSIYTSAIVCPNALFKVFKPPKSAPSRLILNSSEPKQGFGIHYNVFGQLCANCSDAPPIRVSLTACFVFDAWFSLRKVSTCSDREAAQSQVSLSQSPEHVTSLQNIPEDPSLTIEAPVFCVKSRRIHS